MLDLKPAIVDVKRRSGAGGMSEQEYRVIADAVVRRSPCNVLVFGTGYDSELWMKCNARGQTVFLEDSEKVGRGR